MKNKKPTTAAETPHYSVLIQWSEEDQAYVVLLPEWRERSFQPVTHGKTIEEAAKNAVVALDLLVEDAQERLASGGRPLPEPDGYVAAETEN